MEILLRGKGLYRVTMETEAEPNVATNKIKWENGREEAYGLLCLIISRDLLFHLDSLTSPNEVWEKLEDIFGKIDEIRGHQIENELISLSPSNFESLQLYFSKFKDLVLHLIQCGIKKKEEKLVFPILSKLGLTIQCLFQPSMPPSSQLEPGRCLSLWSSWNPSHRSKISW